MEQFKRYSDQRLEYLCSYCGGLPETRDHVPSKVLLDEPYPDNLPVVPCCRKCNNGFSVDEEYFACLIECAISGTTEIKSLGREKVKRILSGNKALQRELETAFVETDGNTFFRSKEESLKNVILKLARGHAKFENSAQQFEDPDYVFVKAFHAMTTDEQEAFLIQKPQKLLPEVGSRALQRVLVNGFNQVRPLWIIVQPDKYAYSISMSDGLSVKMIIRNYLVAEVIWQ